MCLLSLVCRIPSEEGVESHVRPEEVQKKDVLTGSSKNLKLEFLRSICTDLQASKVGSCECCNDDEPLTVPDILEAFGPSTVVCPFYFRGR